MSSLFRDFGPVLCCVGLMRPFYSLPFVLSHTEELRRSAFRILPQKGLSVLHVLSIVVEQRTF